ncbi:type I-C CRISPR-associated protein Cas8c/Csd1 [Streptococcus pluranimalium]|uniref:type I-C CRISPR-associated protein Cas8c/Csd1 n=1 Tax=Streptococcus pluranimalium TaxID=82348 RepID=UPI00241566AA|nr:type I-C CRISPR-associated protein Cas8c/Csd1 [Streptococcus pluranimalium]WFM80278.1 type I-C CRISPR-associated protein Cas8c/Csd1 [Streptococcus pluranimalium]HEM6116121.1 type I-C CRISPR-associated protein Cas8c/Csd1 [Streptococcus suis]
MDFFTSLLKTYENAEAEGWVDNASKGTILLPIYHTSLKSTGKNIISVVLDENGQFIKADIMENDRTIIFPVTSNSVARSGKNPEPHPLVDKFSYYVADIRQDLYETYHAQLENWRLACQDEQIKTYLTLIQNFILQADFLPLICQSLYGKNYTREGLKVTFADTADKEKKVDLSAYFLEFSIDNFIGNRTVSVTNYQALHQNFISYVESNQEDKITCNISGKEEVLATKHRGLIGNAKLISVSNNNETYKGRFKEREDVFTVGNQTSEKIHLMAKYLLENDQTHVWLGSTQQLINWFSDDMANDSQIDVTRATESDSFNWDDLFPEFDEIEAPDFFVTETNRKINQSFIHGQKKFSDASTYYAAILNKTNDGRIALKYFRQLQASALLQHLEKWQSNYSWESRKDDIYLSKTPSLNEMILAAYGVDRDRYLELDNDSFRSDQYQQLVTALLDGREVPSHLVKKLEANLKQRQKYPKHWYQMQQVALAVLHKQNGEEFTPMLNRENSDRSYLFGRLLAIYELIEAQRYALDGSSNDRITNAERYWTAYTGQPAKMMNHLENKVKPYEEVLKLNRPGIWHKLEKEREEIVELLSPAFSTKEFTEPLDYKFIFGYYAEKKFYYTRTVKTESEE